ncbi:hypothetical protein GQ43DRAFT_474334 [Delitschia confertaspora ATCC 74209]|uniref:CFEM domain-containing protein n=1 Tax=Delitschia confertaspora ATCC 74209 TaxID=1513339 RepID=A0A9P4JK94_9PLEO|nr:hypothetical protein GQ43DRAFT_474334 [Delitschia confertaspora ATCC 74209]
MYFNHLITFFLAFVISVAVAVDVEDLPSCSQDCFDQSVALSGCNPDTDKACLCDDFFDEMTYCVSATCGITDNLATLDFLDDKCH